MNERAAVVYDLIRNYPRTTRFAPMPNEACHALGITYREYVRALKWLIGRGFLERSTYDRTWKAVSINARRCDCGAEITPANAAYTSASCGKQYVRTRCLMCWRAKNAAEQRERRKRVDNNAYMKIYRLRRHLEQRSATT